MHFSKGFYMEIAFKHILAHIKQQILYINAWAVIYYLTNELI